MNASATERLTFPICDLPPRRGRKRRIYLKTLEVEVRPLDPASPKMKALLDLLFPEFSAGDFSTNADELARKSRYLDIAVLAPFQVCR